MSKNYSGKLVEQEHSAANAAVAQAAVSDTVDTGNLADTEGGQDATVFSSEIGDEAEKPFEASGKLEKFVIHDEGDEDLLGEEEMDVGGDIIPRLRRPGRNESIKVSPNHQFTAYTAYYKPDPEAMDEISYYVVKNLRGKITQELRQVKFRLCYSCGTRRFFIWPVKVSETDWYRSLEILFRKPTDFLQNNAVRVKADRSISRYRIYSRPDTETVEWPTRPMSELVTEAIGPDNIISSPDHPIYIELTAGAELK